ncbi:MAG: glycosyl hydrolase, partial [Flavobacteriaceae bacterium]|nr:glycosyl hydrolase [Flavobacteriaceae bacterium]
MSYREGHQFSLKSIDLSQDTGVDFSKYSFEDLRKLWRKTLKSGMHGLCFSLYEDGQRPGDIITEEQVRRRMEIIKPYTKWVRSFSCTDGNEFIPKIAKEYGIKTLVGAWLGDDPEINEREIEGLIKLANEG